MVHFLTTFSQQTLCSSPCQIDNNALEASNYHGMGQAVFEKLIHVTQSALDYMRQTSSSTGDDHLRSEPECKMFTAAVNKFYELADQDPELVHSSKILPESTVCLIQNAIAHKAREVSERIASQVGKYYRDYWKNFWNTQIELSQQLEKLNARVEKSQRQYETIKPYLGVLDVIQGAAIIILGIGLITIAIPKLPQRKISILQLAFGVGMIVMGLFRLGTGFPSHLAHVG